jgi:hypothetical protein
MVPVNAASLTQKAEILFRMNNLGVIFPPAAIAALSPVASLHLGDFATSDT